MRLCGWAENFENRTIRTLPREVTVVSMYLLDSDHLVILQRRSSVERTRLEGRLARVSRPNLFLSIVSLHEQALGAHNYIARARRPDAVARGYRLFERLLTDFAARNVLPYDEKTAIAFEDLRAARVRIGTMDLRIAATALTNGFTVLTRNTVDFAAVPGLSVEDWTV